MTSTTKVFLAMFALLIGVLVLYYGVWQRADPAVAGLASASDATPPPAMTMDRGATNQGTQHHTQGDSSITRLRMAQSGNSGLLTDALLQQTGPAPAAPPATDASLDALAANETTSRPAANLPVDITSGGPVPPASSLTKPVVLSSNTATPRGTSDAGAATTAATPAASTSVETEYVIKAGDTGTSIAKQWFGDPNKWILISKANPWVDFNRLRIGQKLKLPPKDATSVKPPAAQPVTMGDKTTYVVQAGDTLAGIARKQLGNAGLWEQIYDANKSVIGSDPGALQVGMKLKLPAKTASAR
jgi:nucleoid-associated protein YgaU